MKIELLKEGQTFKNYKALCVELEMEIKNSTNSKNAQLKELSRYCKYKKIGHKFHIEEVFNTPKEKVDNRGGSFNTVYGDLIQLLITDLLAQCNGHVSISRGRLMITIGMVNSNYSDCREHMVKLAKYTEMDKKIVYDFFNTSSGSFKGVVETALNNLMDKRIIMYNTIIKVKPKKTYSVRKATKEELEIIMDIEKDVLEELGYSKMSTVRISKDWKKFRAKTKKTLHEKTDIDYYYTTYDITVNKKYIVEECNDLVDLLLEKFQREDSRTELNFIVYNNLLQNAKKRHENGFTAGRMAKVRLDKNYIENIKKLSNLLIDKNTPNIMHEVMKIETEEDIFPPELIDDLDKLFS